MVLETKNPLLCTDLYDGGPCIISENKLTGGLKVKFSGEYLKSNPRIIRPHRVGTVKGFGMFGMVLVEWDPGKDKRVSVRTQLFREIDLEQIQ